MCNKFANELGKHLTQGHQDLGVIRYCCRGHRHLCQKMPQYRYGSKYDADPGSGCKCKNLCNRGTKRGACPCFSAGRMCSRLCRCGPALSVPCWNRSRRQEQEIREVEGAGPVDEQVLQEDTADNTVTGSSVVQHFQVNVTILLTIFWGEGARRASL